MKLRSLASPGRTAVFTAILSVLACGPALAVGAPPPDPLPFITLVQVGREDCITCPPRACPNENVLVSVSGLLPVACYTFQGLHQLPVRSSTPVLQAEFVVDTCRIACPASVVEFSGSASLPPQTAGTHTFVLRVAVRTCPDTTVVVDSSASTITYEVLPDCPNPIPVDSLVRTFVSLRILPEHPCAGDTVTLQLVKNGCPPCVHLVSFGNGAPGNFEGVIDWTPLCAELTCIRETLSAPMGQLAQGSYFVSAPMTVRVLGTENPDSTIRFRLPLQFDVGPPCNNPPPCVAREMFSSVPAHQCAVTLDPGASGVVPLLYESELEMGGAQGTIEVQAPFQLMDLQIASGLAGVNLSWTHDGRGARWLVFTDPGVTLAPGARQNLLTATVRPDLGARNGSSVLMLANITLAASPSGAELPLCNRITLDLQVIATRLCVSGDPSACDVNFDGKLDVRDLVRMVGCLSLPVPADIDTGVCVDCNGSGAFDFSDIFCCAREILRGPGVPRDSVRADDSLRVSLGPVYAAGEDRIVHVRVTGARALGATSLRFDYPAERWRADLRIHLDRPEQPVDVNWYSLIDLDDPGHAYLGALRLGDSGGEDSFEFEILMHPTATPLPGDRLEGTGADFGARDGSVLVPSAALPVLSLTAPAPPEPVPSPGAGPLALSPPRPNPFNTITQFSVTLPNAAQVDLAVHDLAGRRVATLAHSVYGAGRRSFTWDGAGVHDGVYFVQLTVDGQIRSTRVALLRNTGR